MKVGYLDSFSLTRVLRDRQARLAPHMGMISRKGVILQSAAGEELSALLPSVLDRALEGEL
jgi:hypothetical protein